MSEIEELGVQAHPHETTDAPDTDNMGGVWIKAEDHADALRLVHAGDLCECLWDIQMWLRDKVRNGHKYTNADEALDAAYEQYFEILRENGIDLDQLYQ